MNHHVKSLALWMSVALNIAFVSAFCYQRLAGGAAWGGRGQPALEDELGLGSDQRELFAASHAAFLDLLAEVGAEIKQRHLELIDRIAQEPTDPEAIHRTQEAIRSQQRRLQAAVVDHLLEDAAVLTTEQRHLFFARLKARIEEARRPGPPWLRGDEERPPSSDDPARGRP